MTQSEFTEQFNRLCGAFSVRQAEDKAQIYFEFLGRCPADAFAKAVTDVIAEQERFPVIAVLKSAVSRHIRRDEVAHSVCSICDGYGWVVIGDTAYRGDCEHGALLSQSIRKAPFSEADKARELQKQWIENREIYGA